MPAEIKTKPVRTGVKLPGEDKPKSRIVAMAQYPDWSKNPEEILEEPPVGLGKRKVCELAQSQNTTNIMNELRGQFSGGPSDAKLREQAMAEYGQKIKCDGSAEDKQLISLMQDPTRWGEYLDKTVEELRGRFEQDRAKRIAEAATKFESVKDENGSEEAEEVAA